MRGKIASQRHKETKMMDGSLDCSNPLRIESAMLIGRMSDMVYLNTVVTLNGTVFHQLRKEIVRSEGMRRASECANSSECRRFIGQQQPAAARIL